MCAFSWRLNKRDVIKFLVDRQYNKVAVIVAGTRLWRTIPHLLYLIAYNPRVQLLNKLITLAISCSQWTQWRHRRRRLSFATAVTCPMTSRPVRRWRLGRRCQWPCWRWSSWRHCVRSSAPSTCSSTSRASSRCRRALAATRTLEVPRVTTTHLAQSPRILSFVASNDVRPRRRWQKPPARHIHVGLDKS